ncbi:amino acid permease [Kutzneria viridogrisea]|uniref:L-asparagine permease n=2 Tax=Kutzneria TaxID=43356 RepID=W5W2L6_9PSEU|nr:amino acid permease [Kutzneria albida]AHH95428.1 L-asparagine permease [Kutzneria albida DSM 43870]MBA8927213.1 L-asparagine permease [Kutzneria viridogrisea]
MSHTSDPVRAGSANEGRLDEDAGYHKGLKSRQVQMIAMGGAIGTGLFLGAGGRLHSAGPSLAIVYAISGVFAFFVVRAMGELVMHRPSSGSFVSYSREFLGEKSAFFVGWMYFLNWAMSGIADVTAAATYVRFFWPDVPQWIPALIALVVVLAVNMVSVALFGELEFWFAAIKVIALVAFMLIAIFVLVTRQTVDGHSTGPQLITEHGGFFPAGLLPAVMILQGVVFAYAAIEMVGVAAGETANPREVIPKAVNSVGWRIAIFYVGSVLLLVMLMPAGDYTADQSPFVTFLDRLGVPGSAGIMNIVVLTAALSSVNSGLYSTGRILRSLSVAGSAPKFTALMSRNGVPYGGVLLTAAIYALGVVLNLVLPHDAFEIALNFSALGILSMWSMIMICNLALQRKAKRGEVQRPAYRLPGAPFTNYVTLGFLVLVLALSYFDEPAGRIMIFSIPGIVLLLVLGWFLVRRRVRELAASGE